MRAEPIGVDTLIGRSFSVECDGEGNIRDLESPKSVRVPYGIKWLLLNREALQLITRMSFQLPLSYTCEVYFKILVGQELMHVCSPPLGGSDGHFSLVDGTWQGPCVPDAIKTKVMSSRIHHSIS